MVFTINGVDVMSKYDTTYASERLTAISGFKINGTDIGKSATPGVAGYTTDDPDTNDGFKTSNVSFNQLFSTSKPLVQLQGLASGWINTYTVGDYYFYDDIYWNNWRNLLRFTIPNIPGIQIPLRILIIGGGGGGGSGGGVGDGVGGGGAGTFLELTMTLNESHNQYYFYSHVGSGGGGGGSYGNYKGWAGAMGKDTYLQLRNASGQAINQYRSEGGAGGAGNAGGHYEGDNGNPDNGRRGSGGGATGSYLDMRPGGSAGDPTYLVDIYRTSEHPTTTVDAARAHDGGPGRRGNNKPGGGGGGAGGGGGTGNYPNNVGGTGGAGYTWISGNRYAGGGGGGKGNEGGGAPGGGDRAAGAGVNSLNDRHALHGTGSGGLGMYHDHYQSPHGGNGATGRVSIAVPRIFIDANHHTFIPLYY
jgi:hypothetical protein